jgi:hypothetical protein
MRSVIFTTLHHKPLLQEPPKGPVGCEQGRAQTATFARMQYFLYLSSST